jgi:hypothetical protein
MYGEDQTAEEMARIHGQEYFKGVMESGRDRGDMEGKKNKQDQHFKARCWYNINCDKLCDGTEGHIKRGPTHKLPLVGKVSFNGRLLHRLALWHFIGQIICFIMALTFVLEEKSKWPAALSVWTVIIPGCSFYVIYLSFDTPKNGLTELL